MTNITLLSLAEDNEHLKSIVERMRDVLTDIRISGIAADLHPTMHKGNSIRVYTQDGWVYGYQVEWLYDYLEQIDRCVRERALAGLGKQ